MRPPRAALCLPPWVGAETKHSQETFENLQWWVGCGHCSLLRVGGLGRGCGPTRAGAVLQGKQKVSGPEDTSPHGALGGTGSSPQTGLRALAGCSLSSSGANARHVSGSPLLVLLQSRV